jgi:hypothetical protein
MFTQEYQLGNTAAGHFATRCTTHQYNDITNQVNFVGVHIFCIYFRTGFSSLVCVRDYKYTTFVCICIAYTWLDISDRVGIMGEDRWRRWPGVMNLQEEELDEDEDDMQRRKKCRYNKYIAQ